MKIRQYLFILFLPLSAFSLEPASDPSAEDSASETKRLPSVPTSPTNLGYLPEAGHFYIESSLEQTLSSELKVMAPGVTAAVVTGEVKQTNQTVFLGYAVSDRFTLGVETEYLFNSESTVTPAGGPQTSTSRKGFSDPALTAYVRIINNERSSFYGRMKYSLSPSVQKNTPGVGTTKGNNGRGGFSTAVATEFFWLRNRNEWGAGLVVTGFDEHREEGDPGSETDAMAAVVFEGTYRFHINPELYFEPKIFFGGTTEEIVRSGTTVTRINETGVGGLSTRFGFLLSPKFLLMAGVGLTSSAGKATTSGTTVSAEGLETHANVGIKWQL